MNIVFDLGGVVVDWRPQHLLNALYPDPAIREGVRRELLEHPDWGELDRGALTPAEAVRRTAARANLLESHVARFLSAVPGSLLPHADTVDYMRALRREGHEIYCLSNMQAASLAHLERHGGFWDVFEGTVVSCQVGFIKPEPEIYQYLLTEYVLDPEETVFIDDTAANVDAAHAFGIAGIIFTTLEQCARDMDQVFATASDPRGPNFGAG